MRWLWVSSAFFLVTACAFTVPTAPTVSERAADNMIQPSAAARQMGRAAGQDEGVRAVIYDEAYRCENRLASLVKKMKDERAARGALTLIGGGVGTTGALSAALLKDNDAKTATAIVAALGSLVAIGSQLVGEPATEMELYQRALRRYESARAVSVTKECSGLPCVEVVRQSLAQCSDENAGVHDAP